MDHKASVSERLEWLMEKVQLVTDDQSTLKARVEEDKTDIKQLSEEMLRNQLKLE
jgi:hypothetical protein